MVTTNEEQIRLVQDVVSRLPSGESAEVFAAIVLGVGVHADCFTENN